MNKENTPVSYPFALSQALIDNFSPANDCSVLLEENFDRNSSEFKKMKKIVSRWNNIVKNQSSTFTTSGKPLDDCSSIKTLELLCKITGKTPNQVLGIENTTPLPNDIELYNLEEVLALCRILVCGDKDISKRSVIFSQVNHESPCCSVGENGYTFNIPIRCSPYQFTYLTLNVNKRITERGKPYTGKTELSFKVYIIPLCHIQENKSIIRSWDENEWPITYNSLETVEEFQNRIVEIYQKAREIYKQQIQTDVDIEPNIASIITKAFSFADTQEDLNILQKSNFFKLYPPFEEEPIAEDTAVDNALYDATQRSSNTNE